MAIKRFLLNASDAAPYGLASLDLNRLGKFVILAGPNGGGKSRILRALGNSIGIGPGRLELFRDLEKKVREKRNWVGMVEDDESAAELAALEARLEQNRPQIELTDEERWPAPVPFVPGTMPDVDLLNTTDGRLKQASDAAPGSGMEGFGQTALMYVYWHLKRGNNAELPKFKDDLDAQDHLARRDSLLSLLQAMVGVSFSLDVENAFLINDRIAQDVPLSQGQKVLLQLAVALHAKSQMLSDSVLILDEPETHLHPIALVEVLDRLDQIVTNGQFWISTHSVPLIAHIASKEPSSIYHVDKGRVRYAERNPDWVLNGLLGGEDGVTQLHRLTGLPAQLAMVGYAAQCLAPPTVSEHVAADPQAAQISAALASLTDGPLCVVDVGAGKGRLLSALGHALGDALTERIEYFALDESIDDKETCERVIRSHYAGGKQRWFGDFNSMATNLGLGSADVVVLCNVFHEVKPEDWPSLIKSIARQLKATGNLLLVEDLQIPVGELPHPGGFIVLDSGDLKKLFPAVDEMVEPIRSVESAGRDTLKAHLVPMGRLASISAATTAAAIESVERSSKVTIRALRNSGNTTYRSALQYSFLLQQNINARLYLDS